MPTQPPHIEFVPLTAANVDQAIDLVQATFTPTDMPEIEKCLRMGTTPRDQWATLLQPLNGDRSLQQYEALASLDYVMMKVDGKLVGVSGLYQYPGQEHEAWIGWTVVEESERGQHYGKELLAHVMDQATQRGCDTLRLWSTNCPVNDTAHAMYAKMGFTSQGELNQMPKFGPPPEDFNYEIHSIHLNDPRTPPTPWNDYLTLGLSGAPYDPAQYLKEKNTSMPTSANLSAVSHRGTGLAGGAPEPTSGWAKGSES